MENVLEHCRRPDHAKRVYVPAGYPFGDASRLRREGYAVVRGLKSGGEEEARRLSCDCILSDGGIQALK